MKTIHKYSCELNERFTVQLPIGAKILFFAPSTAATGESVPHIWCEVETVPSLADHLWHEERTFGIFGTGHEIPTVVGVHFVSTCLHPIKGVTFVWHLYEYLSFYPPSSNITYRP